MKRGRRRKRRSKEEEENEGGKGKRRVKYATAEEVLGPETRLADETVFAIHVNVPHLQLQPSLITEI